MQQAQSLYVERERRIQELYVVWETHQGESQTIRNTLQLANHELQPQNQELLHQLQVLLQSNQQLRDERMVVVE